MNYLLDTDHISFLQLPASLEYQKLSARMAVYSPADFAFSVVSFHEQVIGAHSLNYAHEKSDRDSAWLQSVARNPAWLYDCPGVAI